MRNKHKPTPKPRRKVQAKVKLEMRPEEQIPSGSGRAFDSQSVPATDWMKTIFACLPPEACLAQVERSNEQFKDSLTPSDVGRSWNASCLMVLISHKKRMKANWQEGDWKFFIDFRVLMEKNLPMTFLNFLSPSWLMTHESESSAISVKLVFMEWHEEVNTNPPVHKHILCGGWRNSRKEDPQLSL